MASNKVISDYVNDLLTTSELIDLIKELETTKNKAYPKAATSVMSNEIPTFPRDVTSEPITSLVSSIMDVDNSVAYKTSPIVATPLDQGSSIYKDNLNFIVQYINDINDNLMCTGCSNICTSSCLNDCRSCSSCNGCSGCSGWNSSGCGGCNGGCTGCGSYCYSGCNSNCYSGCSSSCTAGCDNSARVGVTLYP